MSVGPTPDYLLGTMLHHEHSEYPTAPNDGFWLRGGTIVSPATAGDSIQVGNILGGNTGTLAIGGAPTPGVPLHIYSASGNGIRISDPTNTSYAVTGFDIVAPFDTFMDIGGGPVNFQFRFSGTPVIDFGTTESRIRGNLRFDGAMSVNGTAAWSGTFNTSTQTITVTNGIITNVV